MEWGGFMCDTSRRLISFIEKSESIAILPFLAPLYGRHA
jgi:hypothetical protein